MQRRSSASSLLSTQSQAEQHEEEVGDDELQFVVVRSKLFDIDLFRSFVVADQISVLTFELLLLASVREVEEREGRGEAVARLVAENGFQHFLLVGRGEANGEEDEPEEEVNVGHAEIDQRGIVVRAKDPVGVETLEEERLREKTLAVEDRHEFEESVGDGTRRTENLVGNGDHTEPDEQGEEVHQEEGVLKMKDRTDTRAELTFDRGDGRKTQVKATRGLRDTLKDSSSCSETKSYFGDFPLKILAGIEDEIGDVRQFRLLTGEASSDLSKKNTFERQWPVQLQLNVIDDSRGIFLQFIDQELSSVSVDL